MDHDLVEQHGVPRLQGDADRSRHVVGAPVGAAVVDADVPLRVREFAHVRAGDDLQILARHQRDLHLQAAAGDVVPLVVGLGADGVLVPEAVERLAGGIEVQAGAGEQGGLAQRPVHGAEHRGSRRGIQDGGQVLGPAAVVAGVVEVAQVVGERAYRRVVAQRALPPLGEHALADRQQPRDPVGVEDAAYDRVAVASVPLSGVGVDGVVRRFGPGLSHRSSSFQA